MCRSVCVNWGEGCSYGAPGGLSQSSLDPRAIHRPCLPFVYNSPPSSHHWSVIAIKTQHNFCTVLFMLRKCNKYIFGASENKTKQTKKLSTEPTRINWTVGLSVDSCVRQLMCPPIGLLIGFHHIYNTSWENSAKLDTRKRRRRKCNNKNIISSH